MLNAALEPFVTLLTKTGLLKHGKFQTPKTGFLKSFERVFEGFLINFQSVSNGCQTPDSKSFSKR